MADLDVTKKLHVYHLLYRLNLSFAAIVRRCQGLEETGLFPCESLQRFQGFAQELQAEINSELIETLDAFELEDWGRYGKVRAAWEKWLRDPDDVFLQAEERRRELLRQGKKVPRIGKSLGSRGIPPQPAQQRRGLGAPRIAAGSQRNRTNRRKRANSN